MVQPPEQHWDGELQVSPRLEHPVHRPARHAVPRQHWPGMVQAWLDAVQLDISRHCCVVTSQSREQQSVVAIQKSPAARQVAMASHTLAVHTAEQHVSPTWQAPCSGVQPAITHTPVTQLPEQHDAELVHADPWEMQLGISQYPVRQRPPQHWLLDWHRLPSTRQATAASAGPASTGSGLGVLHPHRHATTTIHANPPRNMPAPSMCEGVGSAPLA
jgi:hypothetical protein